MIAPAEIPRLLRDRRVALARAVTRLRGGSAATADGARAAPSDAPLAEASELRQRRDRLARQVAELQWDLGGLAYEMAIRDHFRVDVLVRVAAQLQPVDVELQEIERLLHLEEAAAAGACPSCDALYARGAAFCWRCGTALLTESGTASVRMEAPGAAALADADHGAP
jgi:hypothetical protein